MKNQASLVPAPNPIEHAAAIHHSFYDDLIWLVHHQTHHHLQHLCNTLNVCYALILLVVKRKIQRHEESIPNDDES